MRLESLERTMLAMRDAREAHDVLALAASALARDFKRPCVAYDLCGDQLRAIAADFDADALRARIVVRDGERQFVGIVWDDRLHAVLSLEVGEATLDEVDLDHLRALAALASLALANRALAESNAFKDDLIAMFAHDFKGPLTVISGFSELLYDSSDLSVRRSARTIVDQARRLAKLSDDALALASTQNAGFSLSREREDLTDFVRLTAGPLDRGGDRLVLRVPERPVLVWFDRSRLRHVMDNVVGNALKYSTGPVELALVPGEREVRVTVADRGIGIPPADLERVFSRFGRATNARSRGISGSGVGLYIAKKIVEAHGGRLEVRSRENEGSTFTIVLPL